MKLMLILLFVTSSPINSQTILGLRGGVNSQQRVNESNPDPSTWANGIGLTVHFDQNVWNALWVTFALEYNYHKFRRYEFRGAMIPEIRVVDLRGEDAHIYRGSLEIKLLSTGPRVFRIQVLTGAAYVYENRGELFLTLEDMNSQARQEVEYPSRSRSYVGHTLGAGFQSFLFDQFAIQMLAKYYSDYSKRFDTHASIGIIYELE